MVHSEVPRDGWTGRKSKTLSSKDQESDVVSCCVHVSILVSLFRKIVVGGVKLFETKSCPIGSAYITKQPLDTNDRSSSP